MKLVTGGQDWAEAISILDAKGAVIGFLLVPGFRFSLPSCLVPIADYLGDLSYPLYLCHLPLLILAYVVLGIHSSSLLVGLVLTSAIAVFHIVDRYLKTKFIMPLVIGLKLVGPKVA